MGLYNRNMTVSTIYFISSKPVSLLQPFVTKLGILVHHREPEFHAKKWDSIFKVKVTVWAYIIEI